MDGQEEPTVVCSNCDRAIAESKSFLHEAYCFRNIIRCSKCNEPINKNEVDAHDKENHNLVPCKYCRKDFEAKVLSNHVENCPQKPKFCQFCKCEISSHEYLEHIYQCGSRTRQCAFCNKSILVRDLESHEAACEVEQFTRQEAGLEENTFEDSLDLPPRREAVQETRSIPRKRFEPVRKESTEQNKKRLTKLSNKRGSLEEEGIEQISNEEFERDIGVAAGTRRQRTYERQKTQEELDEELAKELNDEHYYNSKNPNKKKINEKSRSKAFQEENDDLENQIEEEFYGTRKERLTRLDKKKTAGEAEFSNGSRRNNPSRNAKRQTKNQPKYTYEEEDENYNYEEEEEVEYEPVVETRGAKKTTAVKNTFETFSSLIIPLQQRQNEIDPEMHQFYDDNEDAELQRAIQASLESFQN